ncbi:EndoU domain-containing protein [Wolbachia endosymbiont of Pentidionis agamae]|uniref:EndoU domain-containing protein n=1 Tax=Wolbachia endosymbiont of Pentidionis agamae TaxID=3110435 RepID=UPI002FD12116
MKSNWKFILIPIIAIIIIVFFKVANLNNSNGKKEFEKIDQINFTEKEVNVNFEPFFRTKPSDPDFIPSPPDMTEFDNGVLKVCGEWGSYPDEEDFRILLDCPEHEDSIKRIYKELDYQVITSNSSLELFKDELTKVWFTSHHPRQGSGENHTGFRHIFCGEPDGEVLGGMHFVGRYVEAQKNKWAGAIWYDKSLCNKIEIQHPVYTFGMQYLDITGEVKTKCQNGYPYNLHADDILILATKAFKNLGKDGVCAYKMPNEDYQSIFVRKDNSILTFYPDLAPKCKGYDTCPVCN